MSVATKLERLNDESMAKPGSKSVCEKSNLFLFVCLLDLASSWAESRQVELVKRITTRSRGADTSK